jgi:hypothetical protein
MRKIRREVTRKVVETAALQRKGTLKSTNFIWSSIHWATLIFGVSDVGIAEVESPGLAGPMGPFGGWYFILLVVLRKWRTEVLGNFFETKKSSLWSGIR